MLMSLVNVVVMVVAVVLLVVVVKVVSPASFRVIFFKALLPVDLQESLGGTFSSRKPNILAARVYRSVGHQSAVYQSARVLKSGRGRAGEMG